MTTPTPAPTVVTVVTTGTTVQTQIAGAAAIENIIYRGITGHNVDPNDLYGAAFTLNRIFNAGVLEFNNTTNLFQLTTGNPYAKLEPIVKDMVWDIMHNPTSEDELAPGLQQRVEWGHSFDDIAGQAVANIIALYSTSTWDSATNSYLTGGVLNDWATTSFANNNVTTVVASALANNDALNKLLLDGAVAIAAAKDLAYKLDAEAAAAAAAASTPAPTPAPTVATPAPTVATPAPGPTQAQIDAAAAAAELELKIAECETQGGDWSTNYGRCLPGSDY